MRIWQQSMIALARSSSVRNFMQRRAAMSELADRFVGGKDASGALENAEKLSVEGFSSSIFCLGEYVDDPEVIDSSVEALKEAASGLRDKDLDIFICIDPTQLGFKIDENLCRKHVSDIAGHIKKEAEKRDFNRVDALMLDMEDSSVTAATVEMYDDLVKNTLPAALTLQAYLYRTAGDLERIVKTCHGCVRLVKGAFAEGGDVAFTERRKIDENYIRSAEIMLSDEARENCFYPIFATHDRAMIEKIATISSQRGWKKGEYEFEMLYGVRSDLQRELIRRGERVRLYLPFGRDWWPYAVRRVGESPRNAGFLLRALF